MRDRVWSKSGFLFVSVVSLTGAAAAPGCMNDEGIERGANGSEVSTRCIEAALHVESCTGEYLSPPPCDAEADARAADLLSASCDSLRTEAGAAKTDTAWCDWFGSGCAEYAPIFAGPECTSDDQCEEGSWCAEGHCFAGLESAEFDRILDTWTDSSLITTGNRFKLLVDNEETKAKRLELIANADSFVHMQTLLIEDNETGWAEARALVDAAQRGLDVRVIVDWASQVSPYGSNRIIALLVEGGVKVLSYNPLLSWIPQRYGPSLQYNMRIHEKALIVDGDEVVMGGRNVGGDYLDAGRWRDTDVYVAGLVVGAIEYAFAYNWDEFAEYEKEAGCTTSPGGLYCKEASEVPLSWQVEEFATTTPAGESEARLVHSNPRTQTDVTRNQAIVNGTTGWETYLSLVRGARHSIRITNAYFVPPKRLRDQLKAAVARGVRVEIITNSKESNDVASMWWASANFYRELISAGVIIHEWQGEETIHAKSAIIDGYAIVGSYNLDPRSAITNSELIMLSRDPELVAAMHASFEADLENTELAPTEFSAGDLVMMAVHRLAEPLF